MRLKAWAVCLTPFDAQGRIDEAAFRAHLQRIRDAGACAYVGSSNVGEGFTFTTEERDRVFAIAVEDCKGKTPVRAAGYEPQSIQTAIEFVQAAERAKLDAAHIFQLHNGHTGNPKPNELELFYTRVIASTSIPVVISSYPSLGYSLPVDMVGRLLDRFPGQIVALRDAGSDPAYLRELLAISKGRAEVYTTGPRNLMNALYHGSMGFLSSEANIAPALAVAVLRAFEQGDFAALRANYEHLYRLHQLVNRFGGSSGRGIKPLLSKLGLPGGTLRAPRIAISDAEVEQMVQTYKALKLPLAPEMT
jgi:dihydrodipicolinate synthase/N-acetylneuraminate lyase